MPHFSMITARSPAIVFGPGDVGVAHSNHEFVPVDELVKSARVFTLLADSLLGGRSA